MTIKKYKPTSPGRRFQTAVSRDKLSKVKPHKPLLAPLKKSGGRNNTGSVRIWSRGGGHKRRYRIIDFKRDKHGIPALAAASRPTWASSNTTQFAGSRRILRAVLRKTSGAGLTSRVSCTRWARALPMWIRVDAI